MPCTSDDDDDDDDELEVLPPSSGHPSGPSFGDGRPRLSYSGATHTDPVNLLMEDETSTSQNLVEYREDPSKKRSTTSDSTSTLTLQKNFFDDGDDDSSVDSLVALAARLKPRSRCQTMMPVDELSKPQKSKTKRSAQNKPEFSPANSKKKTVKTSKASKKEKAAAERKQQRELKKAADEAEKASKKRHIRDCQQMAGKLAHEEIAMLLDASSCQSNWMDILKTQTGSRQEYLVIDHVSALSGTAVVQWIRKNASEGGATAAVNALHSNQHANYEHIPVVVIVVNDEFFLGLLERGPGDDDYPKLAEWIKSVEIGWRASWKKSNEKERPRIILLLEGVQESLEKQWSSQSRKASKRNRTHNSRASFLPTMEELHDALTWVMIQHQADSVLCKNSDSVATHLTKATRMLSERPYIAETSELQCVKKIPQHCDAQDADEIRVQDTFCRQLQQVPRVSGLMAMSVVSNYYPSLQSLWEDYVSTETKEDNGKAYLLSTMFHEKAQYPKLSKQIHTILTSDNPDQILD